MLTLRDTWRILGYADEPRDRAPAPAPAPTPTPADLGTILARLVHHACASSDVDEVSTALHYLDHLAERGAEVLGTVRAARRVVAEHAAELDTPTEPKGLLN